MSHKAPDPASPLPRPPVTAAMRSIERAFLIGVEGATEVLLVRHGDCYEGLESTHDDPPLSPTGREQARRLGARLRALGVDAVYSSPLRRAQETAAAIGLPVTVDERLIEVDTESSDGHVHVKEEPARAAARVRGAVEEAVARHRGGRVVAVCHGVLILNYLSEVLRLEHGTLRLLPYYTGINVVRVKDGRVMAGSLSDIAHLEGLPWPA